MQTSTGGKDAKKIANDITTGGTRNTQITLTIGSLIGRSTINAGSSDESSAELQDKMLEAVNRALEIALSAAR